MRIRLEQMIRTATLLLMQSIALSFHACPLHASPTIIILNGASASGKTSIARALQQLSSDLYLHIGIDTLFSGALPQHNIHGDGTDLKGAGRTVRIESKDDPLFKHEFFDGARKAIRGMHAALAAYARAENNLIVDYIAYEPWFLSDLLTALKDFRVFFVGVRAPLTELKLRTMFRPDQPIGHIREHYERIHEACIYDLEVDTSENTAKQCAQSILAHVASHNPLAFEKMRANQDAQ